MKPEIRSPQGRAPQGRIPRAAVTDAAPRARRRWETPRVESSEVFTRAGLACCIDDNNNVVGSAGANLPFCFEL